MSSRSVALWCALLGLGGALCGAAPASSHPVSDDPSRLPSVRLRVALPICAPRAASVRPPTGPPRLGDPTACRADAARAPQSSGPDRQESAPAGDANPAGYTHLGAGTAGAWAGVSGRLTVGDGSVRRGTYDFVAGRFMVKRPQPDGSLAWLEAGWAETGWSGHGRQRIYTFDTNTQAWRFYDQYALRQGDRVWLDLHTDADGGWQAWLWWGDRWNLLTAERLPIGSTGYVEQYVEVHVDAGRPERIGVPPVTVDNVRLRPAGGGPARLWRDDVDTVTGDPPGGRRGGYCLAWTTRYDTWSAGDCPGDEPAPAHSDPVPAAHTDPVPTAPAKPDDTASHPTATHPTGHPADGQPSPQEPATGARTSWWQRLTGLG